MLFLPPPPKLATSLADDLIDAAWEKYRPGETKPEVVALFIRGYREKTMGDPDRNDVGMIDDYALWRSPSQRFHCNCNTDPSRIGWNPGVGKPYAMLQPGIWDFYPGAHRGKRPALRQADDAATAKRLGIRNEGKFLVKRMWGWDDPRNYDEWGHQQINIHPMSVSSTSSWACLTIPIDYVSPWLGGVTRALSACSQATIPVALIEGPVV